MSGAVCLHYQSSGNKFYVKPHDIENINVKHLCYYGEMLSITVGGKEIHITETLGSFAEQYQLAQMTKWQRRFYKLFKKLWS